MEVLDFTGKPLLVLLIRAATVLSLHELGAKRLLLGCKLTLQTACLLLAFLLELIFFLLQNCRLVLHILELSLDFLKFNLFLLDLCLSTTAALLFLLNLLGELLHLALNSLELLCAGRELLLSLLHVRLQLALSLFMLLVQLIQLFLVLLSLRRRLLLSTSQHRALRFFSLHLGCQAGFEFAKSVDLGLALSLCSLQ